MTNTLTKGDRWHAYMESAPGESDVMVPDCISSGAEFKTGDQITVLALPYQHTSKSGRITRYKATRILNCRSETGEAGAERKSRDCWPRRRGARAEAGGHCERAGGQRGWGP